MRKTLLSASRTYCRESNPRPGSQFQTTLTTTPLQTTCISTASFICPNKFLLRSLAVSLLGILPANEASAQTNPPQITSSLAAGETKLLQSAEGLETLDTTVIDAFRKLELTNFAAITPSIVSEAEIQRLAQATLGETLGWMPGISSGFYGQGASRPIIRGFDGFRVRMLQDSIGTLDVSASSPDHGIPLEPLLLREIEIHRGPAALLYGNAALGGAINVQTRYLPTELPARTLSGALECRFDSVTNGWTSALHAAASHRDWVIQVSASNRQANDYRIPGRARTQAYESAFSPLVNDPSAGIARPIPNPSGRLPNTFHNSESYSVGLGWFPAQLPLSAAIAISSYQSDYGVPFLFAGNSNDLFGDSSLSLEQSRLDLRLEYTPEHPWLTQARLHFGYGDYSHQENFTGRAKDLGRNFTDTRFSMEAWEGRLDLFHQPSDSWQGVIGIQTWSEQLNPSFLAAAPRPESRFFTAFETQNFGAFINESIKTGPIEVTASARYETQRIRDLSLAAFGFTETNNSQSLSGALGVHYETRQLSHFDRFKASLTASYVERIPTATERFAFWPNPAIQRFLIGGDLDGTPLPNEKSIGIDLGIEADYDPFTLKFNAFAYQIDNFIFLQDIRGVGNPANFIERDARFHGMEIEATYQALQLDEHQLNLSLMGDWIHAHNRSDDTPIPRIPPFRLGSRLEYLNGPLTAGLEIRHAFQQNRLQPFTNTVIGELPTSSFTEINLDISREFPLAQDRSLTLFAQAHNLFNAERRIHSSFLKDVAPLSGRNFILGARFEF